MYTCTMRFQILFHMALSSSPLFFFSAERAIWDGICTRVTVDDVTVAFRSWVHWNVIALGTVDFFSSWIHCWRNPRLIG